VRAAPAPSPPAWARDMGREADGRIHLRGAGDQPRARRPWGAWSRDGPWLLREHLPGTPMPGQRLPGSQSPRGWLWGRAQPGSRPRAGLPAPHRPPRYLQALCCGCKKPALGRSYRLLSGAFPRCSGENASREGKGCVVLPACPCLEQRSP